MKKVLITNSPEETFLLAESIGRETPAGYVITLKGELGTGKTIFAKGIANGMGIIDDVTSPTFSLMEIHDGEPPLFHFDLYRIEDISEFRNLGFEEYWGNRGVSVIEWPEKVLDLLPYKRTDILIEYIDENRRRITVEYTGN
jgi:tRNA threonylcarbamoyladenosine biosynthesis protein TsaE